MAIRDAKDLKLWWQNATIEQRSAATEAAHTARRGNKDLIERREARATTRYMRGIGAGPHEDAFAEMLDDAGIEYRQQVPCGPHNLDFTVSEDLVAVEIRTGSGNHRVAATEIERRERILNERHLLEIKFNSTCREWHPRVIEELIAFTNFARDNKPAPGQYRVIRPNGEPYPARAYSNKAPAEITIDQIALAIWLMGQNIPQKEIMKRTGIARRRFADILAEQGINRHRGAVVSRSKRLPQSPIGSE